MLKEGGLVDELDLMHLSGDQHFYETRLKQDHAHVICLRCGKVEEFFGEAVQKMHAQVQEAFGFQMVLARTEIGGFCMDCQRLRSLEDEGAQGDSSLAAKAGEKRRREIKKN
jgi:Fur family ferric uptake transcriptional regulator